MPLFNEMAAFAHVVRCGGFSQAARMLGVEPSSVSRSVARLEKSLGARLLVRNTRALALTEMGSHIYAECEKLLVAARSVQDLAGQYGSSATGLLRMSAPVAFGQVWLAPRLAGFIEAFPDVDLQLVLDDRPIDLIDEQVDVAVRVTQAPPPGLAALQLCAAPYVLIASPGYLEAHGAPQRPEALSAHRCLHLGFGSFGPAWPFRRGGETVAVTVSGRYSIGNSLALATAAAGGAGIGLIPGFSAAQGLADGTLVRVLPDWQPTDAYERTAYLIYTAGPRVAPKIRALLDFLSVARLHPLHAVPVAPASPSTPAIPPGIDCT
jgi:DNA-binding transcriptional LysR family regulator